MRPAGRTEMQAAAARLKVRGSETYPKLSGSNDGGYLGQVLCVDSYMCFVYTR